MGIARLSERPTGNNCKKQNPPCYGKVFNYTATPKSEYCDHIVFPDGTHPRECEIKHEWLAQIPEAQYANLWMKHGSWGNVWEPMDHATHPGPDGELGTEDDYPHPYNGHDKPYVHQVGHKEIAACPKGERPGHPKCSFMVDNQW